MRSHAPLPCVPTSARRLDVYRVTLDLIACCRPLCGKVRRWSPRMGTQLTEALASTVQNLAEAMRRTGRDRAHLLTVALGSCDEVRALLDAAQALGAVAEPEHGQAQALADRVCAMTYRLRQRFA